MATQRIPRHGQFSQQVGYRGFDQDSVRLPTAPNVGLALGLVAAFVAVVTLIVYYVL
ncbi:MAG: hypothetical protein QM778_38175 [Myxococcales bacterium]